MQVVVEGKLPGRMAVPGQYRCNLASVLGPVKDDMHNSLPHEPRTNGSVVELVAVGGVEVILAKGPAVGEPLLALHVPGSRQSIHVGDVHFSWVEGGQLALEDSEPARFACRKVDKCPTQASVAGVGSHAGYELERRRFLGGLEDDLDGPIVVASQGKRIARVQESQTPLRVPRATPPPDEVEPTKRLFVIFGANCALRMAMTWRA